MKKKFLLTAFVLVSSVAMLSACGKDKKSDTTEGATVSDATITDVSTETDVATTTEEATEEAVVRESSFKTTDETIKSYNLANGKTLNIKQLEGFRSEEGAANQGIQVRGEHEFIVWTYDARNETAYFEDKGPGEMYEMTEEEMKNPDGDTIIVQTVAQKALIQSTNTDVPSTTEVVRSWTNLYKTLSDGNYLIVTIDDLTPFTLEEGLDLTCDSYYIED